MHIKFMKWVKTNTNSSNEQFELWEGDKKIAELSFTNGTRIGRFVSTLTKRIFFFDSRGVFAPKAILKNEYGIKIGKLALADAKLKNGYLELEGKKYQYTFNHNNSNELKVFDEASNKNLITCTFPTATLDTTNKPSFLNTKLPSLFLVLCWYVFHPAQLSVK
jgi:hypothetical protein